MQVLEAGHGVNLVEVDIGEGVAGRPDGDQAWPSWFSGAPIYRVANAVEDRDIDVPLCVDLEDARKTQKR